MTATLGTAAVDFGQWPGVVLLVADDGTVAASNGRLEALLDVSVVGRRLVELLDEEASRRKWARLAAGEDASGPWELIFCTSERMLPTGRFSLLRDVTDPQSGRWLIEHPGMPRVVELAAQVARIDTELSTAQRALVIERARLASALAEAERSNLALDEFAHAVSHDLKAPVRAIREYAELLLDPDVPQEEGEHEGYLQRILVLTGRMRHMIDAALQYARAGRSSERVERFDTGDVLRELVEFLSPPADVSIRIAPDLPVLESERVPFEQVFRNLLSNAITYRREAEAHVRVWAEDKGDCWEFVVADDGPGIPPSQQERIWKLFQTSRPGEGTGLGLALVKRLVEARRGRVSVSSAPGRGAEFRVQWPKRAANTDARRNAHG